MLKFAAPPKKTTATPRMPVSAIPRPTPAAVGRFLSLSQRSGSGVHFGSPSRSVRPSSSVIPRPSILPPGFARESAELSSLAGVQHLAQPPKASRLPFFHTHSNSDGSARYAGRSRDDSHFDSDLRRGSRGSKYCELVDESVSAPNGSKKLLRASVKKTSEKNGLKRRSRQSCPNIPADLSAAMSLQPPAPAHISKSASASDEWHTIEELTTGKDVVRGSSSVNSALTFAVAAKAPKDYITLDFLPLRLATNPQDWEDGGWGDVETIPALDSVSTADAFAGVLEKRGLSMDVVSICLTNSKTPLPAASLKCSSFALGGQKLCVKPRESVEVVMPTRKVSMDNSAVPTPPNSEEKKRGATASASVRKASFALRYGAKLKPVGGGGPNGLAASAALAGSSEQLLGPAAVTPVAAATVTVDDADETAPVDAVARKTSKHQSSRSIGGIFGGKEREKMLEMMENWSDSGEPPLQLEDNWKSLVAEAELLPRQRTAQQEALWELVLTEKDHIEKLGLLGEVQERLRALNSADLLKEVAPNLLLRNIRELERANRSFWAASITPMLAHSRLCRGPLKPSLLEPGFDAMPAWAAPYTDFCLHHLGMDYYIMKSLKSVELFREWMTWIESQDSMRRLHLKDLLATPMQRLTKYPLLLKAVLKNTTDEDDRASLTLMIERASETATRLNVEFSNKHNLEMLRNISATIDSYDAVETANEELERAVRRLGTKVDLSAPMPFCGPRAMRRVWQKGELKLRDGVGKADVLCLLLTDMLIICKADKPRRAALAGPRLRVIRPPFHIQNIRVARLLESREGGFSFVYLNEFGLPAAAFAFSATSHDEAQKWVDNFENALKEFRHARSMADASSRVSGLSPVSSASGLQPPRTEAEMAERRRRRLSVGNVLIDQHRTMSLKPVLADEPTHLLASPSDQTLPPAHRKSSSMDSSSVHAASQHILDLQDIAHAQHSPAGSLDLGTEDERRSRSTSSDIFAKLRPSGRGSSSPSRSPVTERRSRRTESQSPSPAPVRRAMTTEEELPAPAPIFDRSLSVPRGASPTGTLTPSHGSSETLVLAPPEDASAARRPLLVHQEGAETTDEAMSPLTSPAEAEEAAEEDGEVPELDQETSETGVVNGVGSGEKGRRFEKRYHTADGIEAFKPKNTTYPAGILKRFSWNITNAMNHVVPNGAANGGSVGKKGPKSLQGSSEWRKASTMSSDSFCSSSGVSSSSSQLAVNEELLEPSTPVPSGGAAPAFAAKTHVSTICVNEAAASEDEDRASQRTLRISLSSDGGAPPLPPSQPPPLPAIPKIATQAPTPPMGRTPAASMDDGAAPNAKVPNRDDLLKLIMEGQLETSDV